MNSARTETIATTLTDALPASAARPVFAAPSATDRQSARAPDPATAGARAASAAKALAALATCAAKAAAAAHAARPGPLARAKRACATPTGPSAATLSTAKAGLPAEAAFTAKAGGALKRIVRDLNSRARVIAIVSGKGGVGKTNVAVNMAIALAAAGRRVLLVDADLGLANVDLVLGQRPHGDLGHVLSGKLALGDVIQEGPAGIRWIPGASHMPALSRIGERRREALLERLTALETQHDYVLIDAPAGIGQGVLHLARQADELVLVTTPEPTALMDAYALLKAAAASGGPDAVGRVRLVVNMVGQRKQADDAHRRIAQTAAKFLKLDVGMLGYVFCDGHVGRAVQKQQPLLLAYPHSQAAWCMKRLGGALVEARESPLASRFAFFRRLARLFAAG